jgi:DNA-binding beta-propeller fold protein YncE
MLAGCGATHSVHSLTSPSSPSTAPESDRRGSAPTAGRTATAAKPPDPQALVTAETENRLVVVDLRTGRVARRITLPADPENVVADGGFAVAVSPSAGAAAVLRGASLRPIGIVRGLRAPHIPALSPDGRYAYVTDDQRGTLIAIRLSDATVVGTVFVGDGAHHLSLSPDGRRMWIVLGESASTIVILDVAGPAHPRVIARFDPGFPAHDLSFTPDGRRVWVSAANGPDVWVLRTSDRRPLFKVPVGPGPQHIAFDGPDAYLTSGYGSVIEKVSPTTGRVLVRRSAPHGSFELSAGPGFVAASSLLRGTLAIYDRELDLLRIVRIAPAARDVALRG